MDCRNAFDKPILSARLTPHRSLGPLGFALLMGFVGATCFAAGTLFWALGAWPVAGFLGLDVIAVYVAFRMNYRAARAFEEVMVSRAAIVLRRVDARGRAGESRFDPAWVRLETREAPDEGVIHLAIRSRGRSVPVGAFLNPDDRASFARALRAALAEVRR